MYMCACLRVCVCVGWMGGLVGGRVSVCACVCVCLLMGGWVDVCAYVCVCGMGGWVGVCVGMSTGRVGYG